VHLSTLRDVASDHLHTDLGVDEDGRLEPTTNVDDFYDEIERDVFGVEKEDSVVSFSDMTAALCRPETGPSGATRKRERWISPKSRTVLIG
jgi:hypothetical protein